jgi:hypothetical protein
MIATPRSLHEVSLHVSLGLRAAGLVASRSLWRDAIPNRSGFVGVTGAGEDAWWAQADLNVNVKVVLC